MDEYEAWLLANGFEGDEPAEDLIAFGNTTAEQRAWLEDFMTRWDEKEIEQTARRAEQSK